MAYRTALAYPANLVTSQIQPLFQVIIFFFVAQLVGRSDAAVGGDYFTFVVIGWIAVTMLSSGLGAFSTELYSAVQQGQFEMLLVEPVRWRLLPFGLAQWPLIKKVVAVVVLIAVSIPLGAEYQLAGLLPSIAIMLLGITATLGVGIFSGAAIVLAKRGDPVAFLYGLATSVLSGALFPLDLLPAWLRPLSWLIPHTYVIAAMRRLLMPEGAILPGVSTGEALIGLAALNLVLLPTSLWLFGRAMEAGRRMGVLSGY